VQSIVSYSGSIWFDSRSIWLRDVFTGIYPWIWQWIQASKLASAFCGKKIEDDDERKKEERKMPDHLARLTGLHRHRLHLPLSRHRSSLDP
jgi:hypothetical protein